MKERIKISEEELHRISPTKIDFYLELCSGSEYHQIELSGVTQKYENGVVRIELDEDSLEKWILWYKKDLKQAYLNPPYFDIVEATSHLNKNKKEFFRCGISKTIIINKLYKEGYLKNTMNTFKHTIKNLMRTEPEKTFVEVGFLDQEENVTSKGREALEYILWEKHKEELKKLADQIVKE